MVCPYMLLSVSVDTLVSVGDTECILFWRKEREKKDYTIFHIQVKKCVTNVDAT